MGYYTRHKLSIKFDPEPGTSKDSYEPEVVATNEIYILGVTKHIQEVSGYSIELDEFGEECKWYEHEEDLRKISKTFPQYMFTLEGIGEEAGDQWKEYYRNGKMQRCKVIMTFEKFDETKMK
jgi:hypothetical protein